ncbi:MAG: RNA 3'-terminal phosphate cyclase [Gammaproteobacteria bacterium]|nr:MAG: RNA 3'-terminal phosphate cyclase [Gammaproteobacteria bacterium]
MLTIDGETGEGGGQVLRTSLALSMCLGRPIEIRNIRVKRKKPGLRPQHLAAVQAATTISKARVEGAEIGSRQLRFRPQGVFPGKYDFDIGTAGSTTLVAQTVLPALMLATAPSRLTIHGGTHNPLAPTFDFFDQAFCTQLNRLGPRIRATLERPGFFPKGGGIMHLDIQPADRLRPLGLMARGDVQLQWAEILLAHLPKHIAQRERDTISGGLALTDDQVNVRLADTSSGPGNVVTVFIESEHVTEVFSCCGQRGMPAEKVAATVVGDTLSYLRAEVPVGFYLADQLLLPLALARRGEFVTRRPSSHTTTNMTIINLFTGIEFDSRQIREGAWRIGID